MKKPKTRNNNTWTQARFNSFIKSLLRKGTMSWGPINSTKKKAWKERGKYLCNSCKEVVPLTVNKKKNVFVDHKIPAIDVVEGFTNWDNFISNLFCESDNLQVLCCECHDRKSKEESALRRKNKDWPSLTPEYNSWRSMRARCLFKSHEAYKNYGGRGITICDSWLDSFEKFSEDMGERPDGTTLDRIDVDGGYNKDNCKWSNPTEQANNRRSSIYLEFDGECKTVSEWSRDLGIPASTIANRLLLGYPAEVALDVNYKSKTGQPRITEDTFLELVSQSDDIQELVSSSGYSIGNCRKRMRKLGVDINFRKENK